MSDVLARVAREKRIAEMPTPQRAYEQLTRAIAEGSEITLTDHELVMAISRAVWQRELATAQLGLTELETRTALNLNEERQAA